jgi:acetyl-CoA carboxylase carboxyl transferase subunit alpha
VESEERGVAEAIAFNLREMSVLKVPVVVIITGEGGSGGALGIAIGDRILMQEYAIYSVIPPEGCAAILRRDSGKKVEAATALKLTAGDLLARGIVDEIIREPIGGAHTSLDEAAALLDGPLRAALDNASAPDVEARLARRTTSSATWAGWAQILPTTKAWRCRFSISPRRRLDATDQSHHDSLRPA